MSKHTEYMRQWRLNNLEKSREASRRWYRNHKDHRRKYLAQQKQGILAYYGNGKAACVICGFEDTRALSIDHINNNGYTHRKETGNGDCFYFWLRRHNYPEGYQTLCMNCQFIKARTVKEIP